MSKKITTDEAQLPIDESKKLTQELRDKIEYVQNVLAARPHNVKAVSEKRKQAKALPVTSDNKSREVEERIEVTPQLVDDLVHFVKTGEGPSFLLDNSLKKDRSLYTRIAQDIYDKKKLEYPHYWPLHYWPLHFAVENSDLFPDAIKYLLENGASYEHNKSDETKSLFSMVRSYQNKIDTFKQLLDAGYSLNESDIKKLYSYPSICFRTIFDPVIFNKNRLKLLSHTSDILYDASLQGQLSVVQYSHKINKHIYLAGTSLGKSVLSGIAERGSLDVLKYLLINCEQKFAELYSHLKIVLDIASLEGHLQMVHYLINRYDYDRTAILMAQETAQDNIKEYLSYYLESHLELHQTQKLMEFERSELQRISKNGMEDLDPGYCGHYKERERLNQLMHLALTSSEEVKLVGTKDCLMPRLTAINQLLPINPFAVQYAWRQLRNSGDHKEIDSVLVILAKHYKHYTKTTGHITDLAVHENLNSALSDESPNSSSITLPALRAIEARRTLAQFLPKALVSLMMGYAAPQNPLTTPGLIHIWEALNSDLTSKEEAHCQHCPAVLSEPAYFSIFSGKNQEAGTTLASTETPEQPFTKG